MTSTIDDVDDHLTEAEEHEVDIWCSKMPWLIEQPTENGKAVPLTMDFVEQKLREHTTSNDVDTTLVAAVFGVVSVVYGFKSLHEKKQRLHRYGSVLRPLFQDSTPTLASRLEELTTTTTCNGIEFRLVGGASLMDDRIVARSDEEVSVLAQRNSAAWSELSFAVQSRDKGAVAALVSGESGSGKTYLSSFLLQEKLSHWKALQDGTTPFYVRICLPPPGGGGEKIDKALEELSKTTLTKEERDDLAISTIELLFRKKIKGDFSGSVKRLVLIIDEISACLNLARGCISRAILGADEDCSSKTTLLSFAEETFFVFCGTSVEFAAPEFLDPSNSSASRATVRLEGATTHPSRVVCIRLRQATMDFFMSLYQSRTKELNVIATYQQSRIFTALLTNCRAGRETVACLTNKANSNFTDVLKDVASAFSRSNGISSLIYHKTCRLLVQSALRLLLLVPSDETLLSQLEFSPQVMCQIGVISKDYIRNSYDMSLSLVAMSLCEFGVAPAPAVDWNIFEHLCFSYEHLLALATSTNNVTTMQLNSPFPSTDGENLRWPKRLADTVQNLRAGDALVVLNGEKAPFADVFSIYVDGDEKILVRLVQCKFYGSSTKLDPASYAAELLKWSLRSVNLDSRAHANVVAQGFHKTPQELDNERGFVDVAVTSRAALETLVHQRTKVRIEPLFCIKNNEQVDPLCSSCAEVALLPLKTLPPQWDLRNVVFVDSFGPLTQLVEKSSIRDQVMTDGQPLLKTKKNRGNVQSEVDIV